MYKKGDITLVKIYALINIGRTLFYIHHSNIFFDMSPRIMEIKTKINKWNLLELKCFYPAKETIKNQKSQLTDWENIFANDVTSKGLVSKIYKQFMCLNINQTSQPKKKKKVHLKRFFSQKDTQMAKRYMKRCSTSLTIREMQIKTTMKYHLTAVKITIIKKLTNNKC